MTHATAPTAGCRPGHGPGQACATASTAHLEEARGADLGQFGLRRAIELAVLGVLGNHHAGADPAVAANLHVVGHRHIDPKKAVLADLAEAGDDYVRGDEHVVVDARVVADMVSAPQHD